MSTIHPLELLCGLCGERSEHSCVTSYSNFGSPDLDLRPPPMFRGTMPQWVRECPHCGYVRDDLSLPCELPSEAINGLYVAVDRLYDWPSEPEDRDHEDWPLRIVVCPDYTGFTRLSGDDEEPPHQACSPATFEGGSSPCAPESKALRLRQALPRMGLRLAKNFVRHGKLLETIGDHAGAAEAFLRAAWLCDDKEDEQGAALWRSAAIARAETALAGSEAPWMKRLFLVLADMLRRTGEFTRVEKLAPSSELLGSDGVRILRFQAKLAADGDIAAHTLDKVPGFAAPWGG